MNKLELTEMLREETNISKKEAKRIVEIFFGAMAEALSKGERVEIRGLCSFYVKQHKGYTGRNPKTGVETLVKPKKLPFFKPGKELRERINS